MRLFREFRVKFAIDEFNHRPDSVENSQCEVDVNSAPSSYLRNIFLRLIET